MIGNLKRISADHLIFIQRNKDMVVSMNIQMSEALNLILDFSFSKLELNRVEATHYIGNEGSGRVMQKCGMRYEGTGIQEVKVKGIFYDVVHYAILREEWLIGYSD